MAPAQLGGTILAQHDPLGEAMRGLALVVGWGADNPRRRIGTIDLLDCSGLGSSSPARTTARLVASDKKRSPSCLQISIGMTDTRLDIVAHGFLVHGTSSNKSGTRRDMIFQRRPAEPLLNSATQTEGRLNFMFDPWMHFQRRP